MPQKTQDRRKKLNMLDTDTFSVRENPPKTDMNRLKKLRKSHNLEVKKIKHEFTLIKNGGGMEREDMGI